MDKHITSFFSSSKKNVDKKNKTTSLVKNEEDISSIPVTKEKHISFNDTPQIRVFDKDNSIEKEAFNRRLKQLSQEHRERIKAKNMLNFRKKSTEHNTQKNFRNLGSDLQGTSIDELDSANLEINYADIGFTDNAAIIVPQNNNLSPFSKDNHNNHLGNNKEHFARNSNKFVEKQVKKKFSFDIIKDPYIRPKRFAGCNTLYSRNKGNCYFLLDRNLSTDQWIIHTNNGAFTEGLHVYHLHRIVNSTSNQPNRKFCVSKYLELFFKTQHNIPNSIKNKYFSRLRFLLLQQLDNIEKRLINENISNRRTKTFIKFSYKRKNFFLGFYMPCRCKIPAPYVMNNNRFSCHIHEKENYNNLWSNRNKSSFNISYDQLERRMKYTKVIYSHRLGIYYTSKLEPTGSRRKSYKLIRTKSDPIIDPNQSVKQKARYKRVSWRLTHENKVTSLKNKTPSAFIYNIVHRDQLKSRQEIYDGEQLNDLSNKIQCLEYDIIHARLGSQNKSDTKRLDALFNQCHELEVKKNNIYHAHLEKFQQVFDTRSNATRKIRFREWGDDISREVTDFKWKLLKSERYSGINYYKKDQHEKWLIEQHGRWESQMIDVIDRYIVQKFYCFYSFRNFVDIEHPIIDVSYFKPGWEQFQATRLVMDILASRFARFGEFFPNDSRFKRTQDINDNEKESHKEITDIASNNALTVSNIEEIPNSDEEGFDSFDFSKDED